MTFSTPLALLLLLSLPYVVWLALPRRRRQTRQWASLLLRLLIITLLVLSLAGIQIVRAADELSVVFLLDASDSISNEQRDAAEAYVREAMAAMGPDDQAAVVVFGANALVDRPMSGLSELAPVTSAPQGLHTDLDEAVRLGLALFPAGSARRMVLLSDGAATLGDPQEAAQLAAAAGVQIDYVPLTRSEALQEAGIGDVSAPSRVIQGERFSVDVSVFSSSNMAATLRVLGSGSVVHEAEVQLNSGANNFSIPLRATEQEFARYTVELAPEQDAYYQNNRLAAYTEIVGPPRLLLVAHEGSGEDEQPLPDESAQLEQALQDVGLPVDRVTPAELTASLSQLSNYASVLLVNVNARDLHPLKMSALQSYVRDLGGGLVAVGGPQSYGMGGYYGTPLEEALPLDMQIEDQDRFPAVAMAIVVDRSGSMSMQEGSLTKIELANEAAARVVELLHDFDEITVIPVDTVPSNVIGPASAADKEPIISQIRQIGAGGGGINVRTGMEAAAEALAEAEAQIRHIIVLADGADSNEQTGVPQLIEGLVAEGVTVSMVAIGDGKDVPWLQQMADLGQGRFHLTYEAANLPQIFTQETTSIQRSYLVEERFFPSLANRSPILANIQQTPPLYGYVGASPKASAQVILETHMGDPLLASWQYGLGRSVAWTSDATGRWATDWVRWEGFPTFWAQAVRWTITQDRENNVETTVQFSEETASLTADVRGSDGDFLNDAQMTANVVGPGGEVSAVPLEQVAPGRYQGQFAPEEEGAYLIRVAGEAQSEAGDAESGPTVAQTSGWVLGYSPEYRQLEADTQLLEQMAATSNGRDIGDDPAQAFAHTLAGERTTRPIWPWLTILAVLLLPVDVALRRLALTRRDVQKAWGAILGRVRPPAAAPQRSEQVARLFEAKERAGAASGAPGAERPSPQSDAPQTPTARREEQREAAPTPADRAAPEPRSPAPAPGAPPEKEEGQEPQGSLASRLLKRRQQDNDGS
ncbi:MAG: VWA domain-containing protein [bacterium]